MSFNNWRETCRFNEEWVEIEKQCAASDMPAEKVEELRVFLWEQHKSNRRFYEHTDTYAEVYTTQSATDDDALSSVLESLSTEDRELLKRVFLDGCTHAEIAREMGITRAQITKRIARIRACVKFPHD